jgi:hypothetical protein
MLGEVDGLFAAIVDIINIVLVVGVCGVCVCGVFRKRITRSYL